MYRNWLSYFSAVFICTVVFFTANTKANSIRSNFANWNMDEIEQVLLEEERMLRLFDELKSSQYNSKINKDNWNYDMMPMVMAFGLIFAVLLTPVIYFAWWWLYRRHKMVNTNCKNGCDFPNVKLIAKV